MRRGTRLHADQARRQRFEECQHRAAPELLPNDHLFGSVDPVNRKHVLGNIQTDRGNLHVDGSPHVIRFRRNTLWHFDAGSGRRPPHQTRTSANVCGMSAPPPGADFAGSLRDVAEGPRGDIALPVTLADQPAKAIPLQTDRLISWNSLMAPPLWRRFSVMDVIGSAVSLRSIFNARSQALLNGCRSMTTGNIERNLPSASKLNFIVVESVATTFLGGS